MTALGRYIVMLGYAGARTALTLAELHRDEVQKRFPKHFLKQEDELRGVVHLLSGQSLPEEFIVLQQEDEVFPSLWKIAESMNAGLEAELSKIPVLQFVIEVSELFDVNPYVNMTALENKELLHDYLENSAALKSAGIGGETVYSMLVATEYPERMLCFAEEHKIPAAVIGRLTDKNDRVVRNGEIVRYLTPEG